MWPMSCLSPSTDARRADQRREHHERVDGHQHRTGDTAIRTCHSLAAQPPLAQDHPGGAHLRGRSLDRDRRRGGGPGPHRLAQRRHAGPCPRLPVARDVRRLADARRRPGDPCHRVDPRLGLEMGAAPVLVGRGQDRGQPRSVHHDRAGAAAWHGRGGRVRTRPSDQQSGQRQCVHTVLPSHGVADDARVGHHARCRQAVGPDRLEADTEARAADRSLLASAACTWQPAGCSCWSPDSSGSRSTSAFRRVLRTWPTAMATSTVFSKRTGGTTWLRSVSACLPCSLPYGGPLSASATCLFTGLLNGAVFCAFAFWGPETFLVASNSGDQVLHAVLAVGGTGSGIMGPARKWVRVR